MSIFVTSLDATDNEICAPICQSILNQMNQKGFKFQGMPAIEPSILLEKNLVSFTLRCCEFKTTPITFDFLEVNHFMHAYRNKHEITDTINNQIKNKLTELENLVTNQCTYNKNCAYCVMVLKK